MTNQLQLEIVTPYRTILNELVDSIIVPGIEGEMGILSEHVPLLTIMDSGVLSYTKNDKTNSIAVHWGYAQVDGNSVRVLVELVEKSDEIDLDRAKEAENKAKKNLNTLIKTEKLEDEENRQIKYENKLKRSIVRQRLAKMI
tara:strand:- start:707 stop:1132 length:426 start_codon:yes stop_codon:yes gene_type:complete